MEHNWNTRSISDDDAFLTALSKGTDPSDGTDELAAMLLELREDVVAPGPAAPSLPEEPVNLDERRRRRRGPSPWVAGIVGAAAASVVVAGAGAALFGPQTSQDSTTVELASALEEIENAANNGDMEEARELIAKLRNEVEGSSTRDVPPPAPVTHSPSPAEKVTVTVTETKPPVTQTVTVTETKQPERPQAPAPAPAPSPVTPSEPAPAPTQERPAPAE